LTESTFTHIAKHGLYHFFADAKVRGMQTLEASLGRFDQPMSFGKADRGSRSRNLYSELIRNRSACAFVNQDYGLPRGLCQSQANAVGFNGLASLMT